MEPLRFIRKPKNWLEKLLWNSPSFWKVYELLGGESKEIRFNPYRMTCCESILHYRFILEQEKQCPLINDDLFILAAAQRPSAFTAILSTAISVENRETIQSWLESNSNARELAEAYLIFRKAVLELGEQMIDFADTVHKY